MTTEDDNITDEAERLAAFEVRLAEHIEKNGENI